MSHNSWQIHPPIIRNRWQKIKDFVAAPLRLTVLPDEVASRLGLTSLEEERIQAVWPYLQGRLLDIGAGRNHLMQRYGNGVGVDVYDWGGGLFRLSWKWTFQSVRVRNLEKEESDGKESEEEVHS